MTSFPRRTASNSFQNLSPFVLILLASCGQNVLAQQHLDIRAGIAPRGSSSYGSYQYTSSDSIIAAQTISKSVGNLSVSANGSANLSDPYIGPDGNFYQSADVTLGRDYQLVQSTNAPLTSSIVSADWNLKFLPPQTQHGRAPIPATISITSVAANPLDSFYTNIYNSFGGASLSTSVGLYPSDTGRKVTIPVLPPSSNGINDIRITSRQSGVDGGPIGFDIARSLQGSFHVEVPVAPPADTPILKYGGTVTVVKIMNDKAIEADFQPTYGGKNISLAAAAQHYGVDHFNWIQTVTSTAPTQVFDLLPGDLIPTTINGRSALTLNIQPSPTNPSIPVRPDGTPYVTHEATSRIDPVVDPTKNAYVTHYVDSQGVTHWSPGLIYSGDSKPYYWDEVQSPLDPAGEYYVTNKQIGTVAYLTDQPIFPSVLAGHVRRFETELVGVKANGQMVKIPGITNSSFKWSSDVHRTVNGPDDGGVQIEASLPDPSLDAFLGGHVFDIQYLGVPEPSTLALAAIGAIALVARRLRRGRNRP